jgi:ferrochelatase
MSTQNQKTFDSVLVTAFGGPEKPEDVLPFLNRVTQGRVPQQRLEAVARHYALFGGRSPVNEITMAQAGALEQTLRRRGRALPVYVAMRHWHPLMTETLARMKADGVRRAVVVIMSVFQSKASWDQYQSDLADAVSETGIELHLAYARPVFDRPGFIETMARHAQECLHRIPEPNRPGTHLVFTAHSIPYSDPHVAGYVQQLEHAAVAVSRRLGDFHRHIAYQSRSGRPQEVWLEPDVNHVLADLAAQGVPSVVVVPIGFVCDNIEVLFDLGTQARQTAHEANMTFSLAKTVGDAPPYIDTLADIVIEEMECRGAPCPSNPDSRVSP